MKKELLSKRLRLIPVEDTDEGFLFELLRIPEIKKYLLDYEDVQNRTIRKLIDESNSLFQKKDIGLWIVKNLQTSDSIGLCGLFLSNLPELIYIIHPNYQKNGLATEASKTVISYIKNQKIKTEVYAKIDNPNLESHIVARKIGMKEIKEEINTHTNGIM